MTTPNASAAHPLGEAAGSGKYDEQRIAYELWLTARGSHYYGNALYVAMDMPIIVAAPALRQTILRYLNGTQSAADHIRLQEASRLIHSPNRAINQNERTTHETV